jgi:hypothetical protein
MVQAVGDFRGVEVEEEFLVADEGSVVGSGNAWGPRWNPWGSTKTFFPKVDPLSPHQTLSVKNAGNRNSQRE